MGLKVMSLNELFEKYGSDKGEHLRQAPGRAHNYSPFYEKKFIPLQDKSIRLLEMGLQCYGEVASLWTWKDFFPNASIVGFDSGGFSQYAENRITIIRGDQSKKEDLERLSEYGPYDIIIDDCSHRAKDQLLSFEVLYPSLTIDGLYIIEDLSIDGESPWHGRDDSPLVCEFLKSFMLVEYFMNQHGNHRLACVTKRKES